jgi:hypothetical protein
VNDSVPAGASTFRLDPQRYRLAARRRLAFLLPISSVLALGAHFAVMWLFERERLRTMSSARLFEIALLSTALAAFAVLGRVASAVQIPAAPGPGLAARRECR